MRRRSEIIAARIALIRHRPPHRPAAPADALQAPAALLQRYRATLAAAREPAAAARVLIGWIRRG